MNWFAGLRRKWRGSPPPPKATATRFSNARQDWAQVFKSLTAGLAAPAQISIITPLWNTRPQWLAEAAVSVFDQTSAAWEWCLVDDGSSQRDFEPVLNAILKASARVRFLRLENNQGISAASNEGLRLAQCDFACFLDHDDLLAPQALELCLGKLQAGADAVYTDSNKANEQGVLDEPFHKPGWSPEYLRAVMYVGHLLCVRREAALAVGGFDSRFDGVQDFEFILRYSERYPKVAHIPQVLYHWRRVAGSIAASESAKGDQITRLQQQAIAAQLERLKLNATAVEGPRPHRVTVIPRPRASLPKVSMIVDGRGDGEGDFLVFMDGALEPLIPAWIDELLYHAEQPDAGVVGPLVLRPDRTVDAAGLAVGPWGQAISLHQGESADADGHAGSLAHARECDALSSACIMIRRELFEAIGGFDKHYFTGYRVVDLCLRLRAQGKRNVYTPRAVFVNNTPVRLESEDEIIDRHLLDDMWPDVSQ